MATDILSPGENEDTLSAALRALSGQVTLADVTVSEDEAEVDIDLPASIFSEYDSLECRAFNAEPAAAARRIVFQVFPTGGAASTINSQNVTLNNAVEVCQMTFDLHLGNTTGANKKVVVGAYLGFSQTNDNGAFDRSDLTADFTAGLTIRWKFVDNLDADVDVGAGRFIVYGRKLPPASA